MLLLLPLLLLLAALTTADADADARHDNPHSHHQAHHNHGGWFAPPDQPDGVYSVHFLPDGTFKHTPLNNATYTPRRPTKLRQKRMIGPNLIGCGGYLLDATQTNAANAALDAQCGEGAQVGGNLDFYSIVGGTVAYFCNYSQGNNNCYASERRQAAWLINERCGAFWAGWGNVLDRSAAYGWERTGVKFCGRETDE